MSQIEAYEILVREHEDMVGAYVHGIVRDYAITRDITQEAFVRAYRNLSRFKQGTSFGAWIRMIARNLAIDEIRRRGREIAMDPDVVQGMEDILQPFDDASRGETWAERLQSVQQCFHSLPDTLRDPCRLYYYEDHDTNRIAHLLSLSVETVRKRLERARDMIKDCFEKMLALEGV